MPTSWTNESKISATAWNIDEKLGTSPTYNDSQYSYNDSGMLYNSTNSATSWTNESKI